MTPAEYIIAMRLQADMGQVELASRADLSQSAISKYERGELVPDLDTFVRILKVFGYELKVKEVK